MIKKLFLLLIILILCLNIEKSYSQFSELNISLKVQKSVSLYYENGFGIDLKTDSILPKNLSFGFAYLSSRLGSAYNSNAIKQDNFLLNSSYYFRYEKSFQPLLKANLGVVIADFESPLFEDLDNDMPIFSFETGVLYDSKTPFKAQATIGYNIILSDGTSGLGTVYPLFLQLSLIWDFKR